MTRASSTMVVIAVPFTVEGWHAPAGRRTREPRALPRPGRSDRHRRWMPGLGPGRQAAGRTTGTASDESGGGPGPRPRHYAQTTAKPRKPRRVGPSLIIPAVRYASPSAAVVTGVAAERSLWMCAGLLTRAERPVPSW